MRYLVYAVATLACLAWSAEPARAQVCQGFASYRHAPFQVTPGGWFASDFQGIGAFISGGGDRFYGGGGIGYSGFSDSDGSGFGVEGQLGYDMPVDANERVFVCPWGRVAWDRFTYDDTDVVEYALTGEVAGRVGVVVFETATMQIVPTAGLGVGITRYSYEDFDSTTDTTPLLHVGTGFIFNRRFTLFPTLSISLPTDDEDETDVAFGIHFGMNFGG